MDFNLKQWRYESEEEEEGHGTTPTSAKSKFPKHLHHITTTTTTTSTLPLFLHQPHTTTYSSSSSSSSSHHNNHNDNTKFTVFSKGQWQELELQALIYRHMIAGADVPPQLLAHLFQNTLLTTYPLHYCYPHHQPALVQSGYWGKGTMDPEPGRCRRTDGKKWRCSRDVVPGQKYCERHVHRGKNRSRKPVETPTSAAAAATVITYGGDSGGRGAFENSLSNNQISSLSGLSVDLLRLDSRPLNTIDETKCTFEGPTDGQSDGNRTLRRFFDDWPRSLHETGNNNASSSMASSTNLSISMPGNPSSDFSLKLGTGDGDESGPHIASGQRDPQPPMNWGMGWEANRVAPMGGPLAEALRSSMSTSSPKSVLLHQLTRSSASEASYVGS